MKTRKMIAFVLIGLCVSLLVGMFPYARHLCLMTGTDIAPKGSLARAALLPLSLGVAALFLSPLWGTGVWLLWTANRSKKPAAITPKPARDEPGVWPPPPTIPGQS